MNDRIRQLAEQAGIGYGNLSTGHGDNWQFAGRPEELERFAQLIVAECCQALHPMLRDQISRGQGVDLIKKHFGVSE
jgi:hypothetical protein